MKTGIVMEGGSMRGLFTAGLLDVFMENDIHFDGAAGVSAGVTFGCNLKSHQIGRTLRYNKKYCRDKRYASLESLIRTGDLFNAKFDYEDIPNRLDPFDSGTFAADPMEFWVVTTNVDTGEPVYHKCVNGDAEDIRWIRASASLPGVSNTVWCRGKALTRARWDRTDEEGERYRVIDCSGIGLSDGGTSDSVPVRFMEDMGYDRIVVICTQPYGFRKKKNRLLPFLKLRLHGYPELLQAIADRHLMYNAEMDYLDRAAAEEPDRILLIRPHGALDIPQVCHDPDEIQRVYELGRAEGLRVLPRVRAFLSEAAPDQY